MTSPRSRTGLRPFIERHALTDRTVLLEHDQSRNCPVVLWIAETSGGEFPVTNRDEYYNRSKQEGYRSRSAYKLKQIDETVDLFAPGQTVVDLGAAPGGWLQVAAAAVGESGRVIGVDRQRISSLTEEEPGGGGAPVETIRGDMTDPETRERIREVGGAVDVVLSDMAPNMTGEYTVDHARSVHLARQAFDTAKDVLVGGSAFVVKVFDGPDMEDFRTDVEREFAYLRPVRPDATRDSSSEVYLVGKGRLTAPVRAGDVLEVTIEAIGDEGDGIASVDGFTVFVPNVERGEVRTVEITDVKPRFAFATPVD